MPPSYPSIDPFMSLPWEEIQPYIEELLAREIAPQSVHEWLHDWSCLQELLSERSARTRVKNLQDTTDAEAEERYREFLNTIYPEMQKGNQALMKKLLAYSAAHGVPTGMEIPMRGIRVSAELFREENLPLQTAENENAMRFNKIVGGQTIEWDGEDQTITRLASAYSAADRETRREMWERVTAREMEDRTAINDLWTEVLGIRLQQSANAGFGEDYRAYRWKLLNRFDYTPEDAKTFQAAIEEAVVPAAGRIYAKYAHRFGVEKLAPWDLDLYQQTYPINASEIQAFETEEELIAKGRAVFRRVDPEIGLYFDRMVKNEVIDFTNRKGKGPGAFCTSFQASRTPFIFGNAVGKDDDVRTLLHESGHAFHVFEALRLPYIHQRRAPMEFNEVASMAMELLASPYLTTDFGGFFSEKAAASSRIRHLEKQLLFWPYMAVVDAFQHWVYENPRQALDPASCDAAWTDLWERYIPWIDWSGVEDARSMGWHRKRHIHRSPFYYIEYGLAGLCAVQIWANAIEDQAGAVRSYRSALALGGTVPLPDLYTTAGGRFAFDAGTVGKAVELIEKVLAEQEARLGAG